MKAIRECQRITHSSLQDNDQIFLICIDALFNKVNIVESIKAPHQKTQPSNLFNKENVFKFSIVVLLYKSIAPEIRTSPDKEALL